MAILIIDFVAHIDVFVGLGFDVLSSFLIWRKLYFLKEGLALRLLSFEVECLVR